MTATKTEKIEKGVTKDQRTTPDVADPRAVFAGLRGETLGEQYHNPKIFRHHLYYDDAGNIIPTKAQYKGLDPASIPGFSTEGYVEFEVGDIVTLPVYNPKLLTIALATGNFCRLDAQEEILKAHQEAFTATEADGAVTLEPYRQRIAQLVALLEERNWIFKPTLPLPDPTPDPKLDWAEEETDPGDVGDLPSQSQ